MTDNKNIILTGDEKRKLFKDMQLGVMKSTAVPNLTLRKLLADYEKGWDDAKEYFSEVTWKFLKEQNVSHEIHNALSASILSTVAPKKEVWEFINKNKEKK